MRYLCPNNLPVDSSTNLPHLIELEDHVIKNAQCERQINAVFQDLNELLECLYLIKWPDAKDLCRLVQWVRTRMKQVTNTMFFMHPKMMPKNKKITCVKLASTIRPLKEESNRVRVAVGWDRWEYDRFTHTVPATLSAYKIHLNSTISTPGARRCTVDVNDFYYGTPIIDSNDYEHAQIPLKIVPPWIIKQCDSLKIAVN